MKYFVKSKKSSNTDLKQCVHMLKCVVYGCRKNNFTTRHFVSLSIDGHTHTIIWLWKINVYTIGIYFCCYNGTNDSFNLTGIRFNLTKSILARSRVAPWWSDFIVLLFDMSYLFRTLLKKHFQNAYIFWKPSANKKYNNCNIFSFKIIIV